VKRAKAKPKDLAKVFGLLALVVSCIGAGFYGADLNTTYSFTTVAGVVTVAGLGVFLGTILVEFAIVMLIMGEKGKVHLQNAQLPSQSVVNYGRNFLQMVVRKKGGLTALLIIGMLPLLYWIARPLYVFSMFHQHLPEYVELATHNSPSELAIASGRPEDANVVEEDEDDDVPPPPPDIDGEVAPPQAGSATKPRDTNGEASPPPKEVPRPKPPKPVILPVHGKIMPIDANKQTIDPVLLDLSEQMRPRNPDEVGAVAAMWWYHVQVGHYNDSGHSAANRQQCTLLLWDVRTKALLAQRDFTGGPPPKVSAYGASSSGPRPYAEIRDFLNRLPHQ